MQLSQLQGIIQECKKIVSKNERLYAEEQRLNRQMSLVGKQIRQRRIELTKLKYEAKRNVKLQKQSREDQESSQALRRQLKDSIAIKNKELQSYKKISTIIENLQRQIDSIDKKINDGQNQIEKHVRQDELIIRHNQRQVMYLKLKKQLEVKSASNRKHNEDLSFISRERLKNIGPVNELVGKIDLKYQKLCQKIEVQREIINEIYRSELIVKSNKTQSLKTKIEMDSQQQNADYHFKKTQDLNPFQKVEITNILMKQQYKKQEEDHKMGQIVRQNMMNKYNIGRIVNNRNKFKFNLTELSKIGSSALISHSFQSHGNLDYSSYNERLKKLEASKRVRTRQTQMRRHSQQYRNILLNHSQDKNDVQPLPSHSILDVYNQLKKVREGKNKIGNIEIIKVTKYNQKKKRLTSERGGGLQICDQY